MSYFPNNLNTNSEILKDICGALRDLVPFVQFQKREKHPWSSVNFSKVAGWSLRDSRFPWL